MLPPTCDNHAINEELVLSESQSPCAVGEHKEEQISPVSVPQGPLKVQRLLEFKVHAVPHNKVYSYVQCGDVNSSRPALHTNGFQTPNLNLE